MSKYIFEVEGYQFNNQHPRPCTHLQAARFEYRLSETYLFLQFL